MTEKEFYEEFGNIDPELIEAAAPKARKRKKILAVRLIAVAACLTVIIISAFMIVPRLVQSNPPDYDVIFFGSGSGTVTPYGKEYSEKDVEDLQKKYEGVIFSSNGTTRLGISEKADEFYQKLMYLNPTHSDLHSYGAYLVKHKRFSEGFKFLQHRFQKEDLKNVAFPQLFITNKKKRWNLKHNINDKHILVHFEQGFGDTIMFARFISDLQKRCAKVSLVVQNGLVSLFESSKLGVDIYREDDIPKLDYDYYTSD